ncbi:TPA_asm: coat protein [ssRNA phage SRR7976325_3]|uniref:Coat protein n=1 Tax=ssRNA phage SRR7976325_3 TaxID=2786718 RepID=A0A8S5L5J5_9VIRU|nr:coat protein [ssRNA phage SRR7976325_3]DAD52788.1 TPA_asm: coat protein [ssRNA phage SRR7976325_3]
MSFAPTSPITGAAVSGLTGPTYTIVADIAPSINGKQYAVSALGGTQTNVDVNSVSKPFTITFFRPVALKTLPQVNPTTGVIKNIPMNQYKLITRKGAVPAANQMIMVARITTIIEVPAGSDSYEPEEIKAMISSHAGTMWAQASGIADTVITGVL